MRQTKLYPVVMAGGSGSRLWPLSRVLYPKQFLCLKGDLTMLQTTICRLNGVECESPLVICLENPTFLCVGERPPRGEGWGGGGGGFI